MIEFKNCAVQFEMEKMMGFQLGVIGALFLSVASSVSIVICNKALMSNLGFSFGMCINFSRIIISLLHHLE